MNVYEVSDVAELEVNWVELRPLSRVGWLSRPSGG